jgi:predicted permease
MRLEDWRALVRRHMSPAGSDAPAAPEIVDELAQHLADLYAESRADGRSHDEALTIARAALPEAGERLARELEAAGRTLPGVISDRWTAAIDRAPNGRRPRWLSGVRRDLLVAARALAQARGFSALAVATLALGIGATTAIFAAVDTILIRPMPYAHADRLVVPVSVNLARNITQGSIAFADYTDWREERSIFQGVAAWRWVTVDLNEHGDPERAEAAQVSEDFFRLADATFIAGRGFVPADHEPKAARVTVISYGLWQRRFGGEAGTVGKTLRVAGTPVEIVGILPARAVYPDAVSLYLPMRPELFNRDTRERRDNMIFQAIARIHEGVTIEQGDAVLAAIASRVERDHPESRRGYTNRLLPLRESIVDGNLSLALTVLLGAVGAVLLIGCTNLANLVLVRGMGRAREIALRMALGASRWRIVRQQLAESLLLAVAGAGAGLALAAWMIQGLKAIAPDGVPFVDALGLDVRVVAGTAALAVVAVLVAGLVPAIATSGVRPGDTLKDGSSGAGTARRTLALRRGLIVAEIAGAVTLVVGAVLLIRSFDRVMRIDPGVDVDRVMTARVSLPGARYPTNKEVTPFFETLTARLTAAPGVESAAATSFVPAGGGGFDLGRVFLAEGWPEPPAGRDVGAQWNVVTPDYFRTVGLRLLRGRDFDARDAAGATPVAIVSQAFATKMLGDADPIGKRARSWRDENVLREIVGIVGEVRYQALTAELTPQVYVPHAQNSWSLMNIVVRARSGAPDALTPMLRREIAAIDPQLAVSHVRTLAGAAQASVARERYTTLLLSLLAAAAVLLGGLGVYGVTSHAVSAMRRELGVRIALGASPSHLYALVFRQTGTLLVAGLVLGLVGAWFAARTLGALLYETTPSDPAAYGTTVLVVVIATALATWLPARRAAHADPLVAIK